MPRSPEPAAARGADDQAVGAGRFPCAQCGGDQRWDATRQALVCSACGTPGPAELPADTPDLAEVDLAHAVARERAAPRGVAPLRVRCGSCHAIADFDAGTAATRCPFCGSTAILPYDALADGFRPEGIVPFALGEAEARAAALRFLRGAWLAPRKLARLARTDALHGVYMPFWTFDANATAAWSGNGRSGELRMQFDDVLIGADGGVDDERLRGIEPFPRPMIRRYAPRYVAGWTVQRYRRGLDEALPLAHARMEQDLFAKAKREAGASKDLRLDRVSYDGETCKQLLLPLWLLEYRYLGRSFALAVNGATGNTAGKTPVSLIKATVLGLVALWIWVFFQDADFAIDILKWIVQGLWWLVKWPFVRHAAGLSSPTFTT